jgi:hypothetical protein
MMTVASWAPSTLVSLGAQSMSNPTNLLVTNVPGPQLPLYCSGARMRAIFPQVPLLQNQGIGIALMSYAGSVCWGFNSDPGVVPDADVFVKKIALAVGRVREAAAVAPEKKARRSRSKRPTAARPKVPAAAHESDATRH